MRTYMRITLGLLLLASWAGAATLDDMVRDLAGPDDVNQARARQFLPRYGYPAAEKVLPLLSSTDQHVWRTAQNVLLDIANEANAAGREAAQAKIAELCMTLVEPEQPQAIKIRGLDLLAVVTPQDANVKPIAVLLGDPDLRERARAALQTIGSPKACEALAKGLKKADAEFQCALLNSLAACRDPKTVRAAKRLLKSDDACVRAAAARAVAWTGDPRFVEPLRDIRAAADEATRRDATDALLRLADAMARNSRPEAIAVYGDVVKTESDPVLAGAALASLIRFGGKGDADTVAAALSGEKRAQFEPVAVAAFEARRNAPGNDLLLAVYPATPPSLRPALIGAMGRKRDAAFQDALLAALKQPATRVVSANALADSRLPGAAAALESAVQTAAGDERAQLQAALQRLAVSCRNDGNPTVAGEGFLALYRVADAPEVKRLALENLAKNPSPEALVLILPAVERGEVEIAKPETLGAMAHSLAAAGRRDEAARVVGILAGRATSTEAVASVLEAAKNAGGVPGLGPKLGFVTNWRIVGPFAWAPAEGFGKTHIGEPAVDLNATYAEGGKSVGWQAQLVGNEAGIVDLGGPFGGIPNATAYGFARINVPADADAVIRAGSDDGIKIWVNGQQVHENAVDRGTALDSDQAPVKLKAGNNDILVRITQGGGGWNYCLRLTQPDGKPLPFTQE